VNGVFSEEDALPVGQRDRAEGAGGMKRNFCIHRQTDGENGEGALQFDLFGEGGAVRQIEYAARKDIAPDMNAVLFAGFIDDSGKRDRLFLLVFAGIMPCNEYDGQCDEDFEKWKAPSQNRKEQNQRAGGQKYALDGIGWKFHEQVSIPSDELLVAFTV